MSLNGQVGICGAKTKTNNGAPCLNPPMTNGRCRMHGGKTNPEAQMGNKNAVRTGVAESIFYDVLDEDERNLWDSQTVDIIANLDEAILLSTVRERRMMIRIQKLKDLINDSIEIMTEDSDDGMVATTKVVRENKLKLIQEIEEALTRVSSHKQKLLEAKHKIEQNTGISSEIDISVFIKAISGEANQLWDEEDESSEESN